MTFGRRRHDGDRRPARGHEHRAESGMAQFLEQRRQDHPRVGEVVGGAEPGRQAAQVDDHLGGVRSKGAVRPADSRDHRADPAEVVHRAQRSAVQGGQQRGPLGQVGADAGGNLLGPCPHERKAVEIHDGEAQLGEFVGHVRVEDDKSHVQVVAGDDLGQWGPRRYPSRRSAPRRRTRSGRVPSRTPPLSSRGVRPARRRACPRCRGRSWSRSPAAS